MSIICTTCNGTGVCQNCGGQGTIRCSHCNGTGQITINCPVCGGSGKIDGDPCGSCNGSGHVSERCGTCNGAGNFECNQCHSSGKCKDCGGTGKIGDTNELFSTAIPCRYAYSTKQAAGGGWHSSGFIDLALNPRIDEILVIDIQKKSYYFLIKHIIHYSNKDCPPRIFIEELAPDLISELT